MPLSEEELRMLEQMERALVEEDPKLASTLRGTSFQRATRRRAVVGGVILVVGIAVLVAGVLLSQPVLGVVGFVVMLGGAVVGVTAMRTPAPTGRQSVRDTRHSGLGVVDGGRRHRPGRSGRGGRGGRSDHSFMDRMEERWRRRRETGGF